MDISEKKDQKQILQIYKKPGETPLEAIQAFKKENPSYKDVKMTYAGRLDPLAEGLLLVLVGDMVHKKTTYLDLPKEYMVDVLLGFSTDSYDVLGLVDQVDKADESAPAPDEHKINNFLMSFLGKFEQIYPPFSSKTVKGKPLWHHARNDALENGVFSDDQKLLKSVEIFGIEFLGSKKIKKNQLLHEILAKIDAVAGDFRQKTIRETWQKIIEKSKKDEFSLFSIRVRCSSGTYMRSLAHNFGQKIDIPALAYSIKRLKIGDFSVE